MSWLSSAARNISPLLSLIPGPIGAVAGGVSGLLAGSDARKKEDAAIAQQKRIAEQQYNAYGQYVPGVASAYAQTAGIGPGGSYDPSYNPYAAYSDSLFNPSDLSGEMIAYREAAGQGADSAVRRAQGDALRHGFTGRDSLSSSNTSNIRRGEMQGDISFNRGLLQDLFNQRRSFLAQGVQAKQNAQQGLAALGSGSAQGAMGTFGGLQGVYEDRAKGAGQGVAALAGVMPNSSMQGPLNSAVDWFKRQTGINRRPTPPIQGGWNNVRTGTYTA